MMSLTFDLFTQVSGSGPLGPLVALSNLSFSMYPFLTSLSSRVKVEGEKLSNIH